MTMSLKVIGTGFGRTGTDSMREALNILGFGPCHHMLEVHTNPVMKSRWRALMKGGEPDWDALFEGYNSCVDWPSAYYWRELVDLYPEARVLLTWRPAEDWWKSFSNTLLLGYQKSEDREAVGFQILGKVFGSRIADRDHCIRLYEENVAEVKATVPAELLLVYRLGDGWDPLCAHLGVPVPDAPYPLRNTTAEMQARFASQ
jgi:hypothetical protein